jgi:hypothetical protein
VIENDVTDVVIRDIDEWVKLPTAKVAARSI